MASKGFVKFNWASWLVFACVRFRFKGSFNGHHPVRDVFCCLFLVFGIGFCIIGQAYITPTQLTALISSLPAKMKGKKPHRALCNDLGSWAPNWPFSNSASSSASVSSLVAFGRFHFPWRARFFRFAARTSLVLENSLSLRMLIRLPFSCTWRWKTCWKRLYSVPSCLRTEIKKKLDKRRSSLLSGMFSML